MPNSPRNAWILAAAFGLAGCLFSGDSRGGSEVEDEITGRLYEADGKPAAQALVRVYRLNHIPDSLRETAAGPEYETQTDANGKYFIDSLPRGYYTVLGRKGERMSFQDSVFVTGKGVIPSDTLGAAGALSGAVKLQPNHDPRAATVQVLGTDISANADVQGAFTLDGLAAGRYRLRAVANLPDYTPLFRTVEFDPASDTVYSLELPYTGIPVVTGLRGSYDALNKVVVLRWQPTPYANTLGYVVYRDSAGTVNLSKTPYNKARITDTAFWDYQPEGGPVIWEYRVAVMSRSGHIGEVYQVAAVPVPSRGIALFSLIFVRCPNCWSQEPGSSIRRSGVAWKGDVISLVADWAGATTPTLEWYRGRELLSRRNINSWGSDTLRYAVMDTNDVQLQASLLEPTGRRSFYFDLEVLDKNPGAVTLNCPEGTDSTCTVSAGGVIPMEAAWSGANSRYLKLIWYHLPDTSSQAPWILIDDKAVPRGAGKDTLRAQAPDSVGWFAVRVELRDSLVGWASSTTRNVRVLSAGSALSPRAPSASAPRGATPPAARAGKTARRPSDPF